MANLAKIVRSAVPGTGLQFRREPYRDKGVRQFLRDVIAMANAAAEGPRYIIIGTDLDKKGVKRLKSVTRDDFSGKPSYQGLVSDFVEPAIKLTYQAVTVDGKRLGVFEFGHCEDHPYMMRIDHCEKLRRGDAYIRVDDMPVKMGRRQLQEMFEKKFHDSVSANRIEIGFPGEIIHKNLKIPTIDLAEMPSACARDKLKELLDIQANSKNTGSTTGVLRLAHARLFGSTGPYETWTPTRLMDEMSKIETNYQMDDQHFLFETNAQKLQLVVYNQGDEPIRGASLAIVLPNHSAFYLARQLPRLPCNGKYEDRGADEQAAYPSVILKDGAIHISNTLGDIPTGLPVNAFDTPLRICVGSDLEGRKLGIRYSLFGQNLRSPVKGKLRLLF
jgi:hypothetical protein